MEKIRRENKIVELDQSFLATQERDLQPMVKEYHISPKKKKSIERGIDSASFRRQMQEFLKKVKFSRPGGPISS